MNKHISDPTFNSMLLLDDHYISQKRNVERSFYSPEKLSQEPFIHTGQSPWDMAPLLCGTVKYDPFVKKYRMWYHVSPPVKAGLNAHHNMSLALSQSNNPLGPWRPVNQNLITHKNKNTNMIFSSSPKEHFIETCSVLIDSEAEEKKKYLMAYCAWENKKAVPTIADRYYRLAWSKDGIHWNRGRKFNVNSPGRIDRHCLLKNSQNGEYLFYYRGEKPFKSYIPTEDSGRRNVMLMASKDLKHWHEKGIVMQTDSKDPPFTNIYSLNPFFRSNTLVGIYQIHNQHEAHQLLTTHLCWSHNLTDFQRRREEFIPVGSPGEWDRFNQTVASAPVIHGDNMYFYYSGRANRHSGYVNPNNDSGALFTGISIAKLKLDRFASLSASFDGGFFITKPLQLPEGNRLFLNADTRWGEIDIEFYHGKKMVHSATLKKIEGVKIPIVIPSNISEQPTKIKFTLKNAKIFAIYTNE